MTDPSHACLVKQIKRALAHQQSFPERRPILNSMLSKLEHRLHLQRSCRKIGLGGVGVKIIKYIRPLATLAPLDQALSTEIRSFVGELNKEALASMTDFLGQATAVVTIISCDKNLQKSRPLAARFSAWGEQDKLKTIVITGNKRLPDWRFRFNADNHHLEVSCADNYESLPLKILTLLWVLSLQDKAPAVLKVDDDARPGESWRLSKLLDKLNRSIEPSAAGFPVFTPSTLSLDRGWHLGKSEGSWKSKPFDSIGTKSWMSGGAGYALNSSAVNQLSSFYINSWGFASSMVYEDVCISMLMQAMGAKFHWLENPYDLGISTERHIEIDAGLWQNEYSY